MHFKLPKRDSLLPEESQAAQLHTLKHPEKVSSQHLQENGALLNSADWKYLLNQIDDNTINTKISREKSQGKLRYSVVVPEKNEDLKDYLFVLYPGKARKGGTTIGKGNFSKIKFAQKIDRSTGEPLEWCAVKFDDGKRIFDGKYDYLEIEILKKLNRLKGTAVIERFHPSSQE